MVEWSAKARTTRGCAVLLCRMARTRLSRSKKPGPVAARARRMSEFEAVHAKNAADRAALLVLRSALSEWCSALDGGTEFLAEDAALRLRGRLERPGLTALEVAIALRLEMGKTIALQSVPGRSAIYSRICGPETATCN